MKPKNFIVGLLVLAVAGLALWRISRPPAHAASSFDPGTNNSDSARFTPIATDPPFAETQPLTVQTPPPPSPPLPPPPVVQQPPPPPPASVAPPATSLPAIIVTSTALPTLVALKDDPQVIKLADDLAAQRQLRRQTLEQSLLEFHEQTDGPLQVDMQNSLDELNQPLPPPTDFGAISFANGVPVQLALASGEATTLTPTVQPNGLLRVDVEIDPLHPNRFSSPDKGGFADASSGQVEIFAVGDHIIRLVPVLKSAPPP